MQYRGRQILARSAVPFMGEYALYFKTRSRSGPPLRAAPRTDPYVRRYLIRLLPWVCNEQPAVPPVVWATVRMTRNPGSESGTRPSVVRSPWSCSFPPRTPPPPRVVTLFARFVGTTSTSDSPATCMSGSDVLAFPDRSAPPSGAGAAGVSRFSRMEFPRMCRVFDSAASKGSSRSTLPFIWPSRVSHRVGTPKLVISELHT